MPSNTTKTAAKRRNRDRKVGRAKKRERMLAGTPKFPIHVEEPTPEQK